MKKAILIITLIASFIASQAFAEQSTVLITGANRGIGLEYAKQFTAKGYKVIGTARKPASAKALKALNAEVLQLDVTNPKSIQQLKAAIGDRPIDILINNAGYFDREDVTLDKVDFKTMEKTFAINSLGPLRVTQALIDNISKSKLKKVVSMSSGLGSIEMSKGRWYAYRASKSALNQFNKIMSEEFRSQEIIFTVVHPGWVQTDMGGSSATYTPEESVKGLIKVIEGLSLKESGQFFDFTGKNLPW